MNPSARLLSTILIVVALTAPAFAKKNNPNIELQFRPQQAVAAATVGLTTQMLERPVEFLVKDSRPGDEPSKIGTRTDDDDSLITLRAVGEVGPFVSKTLTDLGKEWGLKIREGSDLVLEISLVQWKVVETNQAVGATFNAEARLSAEFRKAGGEKLWSGTGSGDATRYGKKFSNENANEVLSDALLEALSDLLGQGGLQDAWSAGD